MGTKPTQNQMIAAHLNDGHTITPIDALNMFGCFRLGARIADLKKQGMDIKTRIVHDKATGKHWAEYYIPKPAQAVEISPTGEMF